ncbi:MAG: 2-oxoacid:acceptor oxidoreductase family protein [Clostridiaceae bacterium]|nr:2-oxoacid:acceptor oxidoreductase family protein [Eubacteriales bacterium]
MKELDIYIAGLGGQGILTIGELLTEAAHHKGMYASFYPTKGMSQRGGFVQGQLRLGRECAGQCIPLMGADVAVAMERSEALKAIRYLKSGADFLLFDSVWPTAAMLLNKAEYPSLELVKEKILGAGARLVLLSEDALPVHNGKKARANMVLLGAMLKYTKLSGFFSFSEADETSRRFFSRGAEENAFSLSAGYEGAAEITEAR